MQSPDFLEIKFLIAYFKKATIYIRRIKKCSCKYGLIIYAKIFFISNFNNLSEWITHL